MKTTQNETNPLTTLTANQLRLLAQLKELIENLESPLREIIPAICQPSQSNGSAKARRSGKTGRRMSPEGRAKIAAAARRRWRKAKAAGRNSL